MIHLPSSLNDIHHPWPHHPQTLLLAESFAFFFARSSHLGLFTCLTEAYSECDCCWKDFPPSPEGLFRPGAAVVIGLGDAWSVSTSGAELGSCSGEPPTSVLLCCFTAARSRCQAMGKMLQTFPGMKWFDKNSSLSALTSDQEESIKVINWEGGGMSSLLFLSSSSLLLILKNSKFSFPWLYVGASGRTVVLSTSTGWFTSPQLLYQSGHCQLWPMKITEDTGGLFFFDSLVCTHKHTHAQTKEKQRYFKHTHTTQTVRYIIYSVFTQIPSSQQCPPFQTSRDCRRDGWRDGTEGRRKGGAGHPGTRERHPFAHQLFFLLSEPGGTERPLLSLWDPSLSSPVPTPTPMLPPLWKQREWRATFTPDEWDGMDMGRG